MTDFMEFFLHLKEFQTDDRTINFQIMVLARQSGVGA